MIPFPSCWQLPSDCLSLVMWLLISAGSRVVFLCCLASPTQHSVLKSIYVVAGVKNLSLCMCWEGWGLWRGCLWRPEVNSGVVPEESAPSPLDTSHFLKTGFLTALWLSKWVRLPGEIPQGSIHLCLSRTVITSMCHNIQISTWVLEPELRSSCLQNNHFMVQVICPAPEILSFWWSNDIPLYAQTTFRLSIHWWRISCFYFLNFTYFVILDNITVNMYVK